MKIRNLFYILAAAAMFTAVSCKDEKEPDPTPTPEASITVAPSSVSVTAAGETKSLTVKATGDWTVKSSASWAKVSPEKGSKDGSVSVTVEANIGAAGQAAAAREATVSFAMGDKKVDVKVSQSEETIVFVVNGDTAEIPAAGGKVNVSVEHNESYTTETLPDWITPATKATATDALVYDVAANDKQEARQGEIAFKSASGKTGKVTVKQAAAEAPVTNPNVFKTGEELAAFLSDQNRLMNTTETYELGADIDLTGITLAMPDSLKATFDGKGFSLKNWKTENPLFKVNAGTVQNLNIDASCELKFDGAIDAERCFAFIVGDNSLGLVKNCSVAGNVNIKNSTAQKVFIAGVVARQTKGRIEGCKFSGSVDVELTNSAACSAIAGVVGRPGHVDMVGQAIVKDCVNEGNVKFVFSGEEKGMKKFGVGGVIGQTPSVTGAKDKETPNHGIIEGCTNKGNIYWSYPAGGSGSYPCMGGVAGIIEGEIKGCSNYGTIEYAGGPSVAATDANFGGVAGYVTYNASDCHNYGQIKISGTLAGGTQYAQSGGNTSYSSFGGVFGGVGPYVYDANTAIVCENCSNEADLVITPSQVTSGGPGFPIGGVAGASSALMKNCTNNKSLTVKSNTKTCFVGGISGYAVAGAENCVNNGAITMDGDVANAPVSISGFTQQEYVGGVIGTVNLASCTFKDCKNTAPVTIVDVLDSPSVYSYAAGILGSHKQSYQVMTGCVNSGDITNNANTAITLGGLCGGINGTVTDCKNSGKVIANKGDVSGKPAEIGGMIGYLNGTLTGCENTGDVVNAVAGAACSGFVGAIDSISPTWAGNTVNCSVTGEASLGAVLGRFRTDNHSDVLTLGAEGAPFTLKGGVASMPLCAFALTGNSIAEVNVVRDGSEPAGDPDIPGVGYNDPGLTL